MTDTAMSGVSGDFHEILTERGITRALDAFVIDVAFSKHDSFVAFGLGDGALKLVTVSDLEHWHDVAVHDGAVLCLAVDAFSDAVITGGDDGKLNRVNADGSVEEIAAFGSKWIEHVTSHANAKGGTIAASVGKVVTLIGANGNILRSLSHPSTVSGMVFDSKGKRIGVAHYNGVSLWYVGSSSDKPRFLEWKGSHIAIAFHPSGDIVVTAMQENALHGWRLSDGHDMRMSGYPAKTQSLSFSHSGKWLATSGADSVVVWPFFGNGPMGKPPLELATAIEGVLCTRVACHPQEDVIAAGFSNGAVLIIDIATRQILPIAAPGRGSISALSWSANGAFLAFGTEAGIASVIDLSRRG